MSGPEGTFDRWLARIPDPFLFVLVLTLVTAGLALLQPGVTVGAVVDAWGNGLGGLLAFTTQIALTLLLAHALSHTDAMTRLLGWVARLPHLRGGLCRGLPQGQRPEFAGLVPGLAGGALLAQAMAREGAARGWRLITPCSWPRPMGDLWQARAIPVPRRCLWLRGAASGRSLRPRTSWGNDLTPGILPSPSASPW